MKKTVFMFPGLGSQYYHMGKELYENINSFNAWMNKLDEIAEEINGYSIISEVYNAEKDMFDLFDQLLYTSPAIFMAEYTMAQVLIDYGITPDYVLGTSVGEMASAAVAGIISPEDALETIITNAKYIESTCERGAMIAVLEDASFFENTPVLYNNSELAALNFDTHIVVACRKDKSKVIADFLDDMSVIYQELPVTYGFHSSLIDPADPVNRNYTAGISRKASAVPLISCIDGEIRTRLPDRFFWDICREPIRFSETIEKTEIKNNNQLVYVDLGPGGTLANFAKRNLQPYSKSEVYPIMTMFNYDLKNFNKVLDAFRHEIIKERAFGF